MNSSSPWAAHSSSKTYQSSIVSGVSCGCVTPSCGFVFTLVFHTDYCLLLVLLLLQLPPGGGQFHEDLIVRQVMRRVVQALVMEESLLLLEGTDKATRLLQQAGKGRKGQPGSKPWALW